MVACFQQTKTVALIKNHSSYNLVDWRYSQKELYQIAETISLEDFQQQQHQKWITHVTGRENNDKIKMLTFHTTLYKRLGRNTHLPINTGKSNKSLDLRKLFSWKIVFKERFYEFQLKVALSAWSVNAGCFLIRK